MGLRYSFNNLASRSSTVTIDYFEDKFETGDDGIQNEVKDP